MLLRAVAQRVRRTPARTVMDAQGRVRVPLARPGIGVDVDAGRVDDLTVRSVTLRAH